MESAGLLYERLIFEAFCLERMQFVFNFKFCLRESILTMQKKIGCLGERMRST